MSLLTPIIQVYNYTLQPVAPFTWFNLPISTLDVVAALRLCIVLRQIKESLYQQHVSKNSAAAVAPKSFARDIATTITVVYGGEVMTGALKPLLPPPPGLSRRSAVTVYPPVFHGVRRGASFLRRRAISCRNVAGRTNDVDPHRAPDVFCRRIHACFPSV
jgi:hypothetical protein